MQTIAVDSQTGAAPEDTAAEYEIDVARVREAMAFYDAHRPEIDASMRAERELEEGRD